MLLSMGLIFSIVGCGSKENQTEKTKTENTNSDITSEIQESATPEPTEEAEEIAFLFEKIEKGKKFECGKLSIELKKSYFTDTVYINDGYCWDAPAGFTYIVWKCVIHNNYSQPIELAEALSVNTTCDDEENGFAAGGAILEGGNTQVRDDKVEGNSSKKFIVISAVNEDPVKMSQYHLHIGFSEQYFIDEEKAAQEEQQRRAELREKKEQYSDEQIRDEMEEALREYVKENYEYCYWNNSRYDIGRTESNESGWIIKGKFYEHDDYDNLRDIHSFDVEIKVTDDGLTSKVTKMY